MYFLLIYIYINFMKLILILKNKYIELLIKYIKYILIYTLIKK